MLRYNSWGDWSNGGNPVLVPRTVTKLTYTKDEVEQLLVHSLSSSSCTCLSLVSPHSRVFLALADAYSRTPQASPDTPAVAAFSHSCHSGIESFSTLFSNHRVAGTTFVRRPCGVLVPHQHMHSIYYYISARRTFHLPMESYA